MREEFWKQAFLRQIEGHPDKFRFSEGGLSWRAILLGRFRKIAQEEFQREFPEPKPNEWFLDYVERLASSGTEITRSSFLAQAAKNEQMMDLALAEIRVLEPTAFKNLQTGVWRIQQGKLVDALHSLTNIEREIQLRPSLSRKDILVTGAVVGGAYMFWQAIELAMRYMLGF